mmetsp:Transcript_1024/g.2822  ORF Transcript_1024/g.2822 Transcript_1024/m.2822 type:complete len:117 (+) Transcript_1024:1293-1643(+)
MPWAAGSFDAAVMTLVLCSVGDARAVVQEIQRVVRPGGQLLFVEHVGASWRAQTLLRLQQTVLEPLQVALADGCHLTRDTGKVMRAAGFSSLDMTEKAVPGVEGLLATHVYGLARV